MLVSEIGWRQAEPLRRLVLHWPPGPVPGDLDVGAVHLGVHESAAKSPRSRAELIGVVSMVQHPYPGRADELASYFWGMAVLPNRQCLGVGTAMLRQILARASAGGATLVWADARLPAMPFYEQAGGVAVGEIAHDAIAGVLTRRLIFELSASQPDQT